jgi:hypothetical protein
MRDIIEVYNKIIKVIPDDQVELKTLLKEFIDSLWNKAPEIRRGPETFVPFGNILINNISNILELNHDEPRWKFDVRDIFEGNLTRDEENGLISEIERNTEDSYDIEFQKKFLEEV